MSIQLLITTFIFILLEVEGKGSDLDLTFMRKQDGRIYIITLIESFDYMICLSVSKFYEFLKIRSMSDNENTPSLNQVM